MGGPDRIDFSSGAYVCGGQQRVNRKMEGLGLAGRGEPVDIG